MATGNTHPRLTNEDVANLAIPVPAPAVQERITAKVARRRQQVRRLRAEADAGWQTARRWFEEQLLGAVE
jgi:neutral trehalase